MARELTDLGQNHADIAGIYVVARNGALFDWTASGALRPHPPTTGAEWYRRALTADPHIVFLPTAPQGMILVATDKVFSLVRTIHARTRDGTAGPVLGVVRVDLDGTALARVVQRVDLGADGRLIVVTRSGGVVYPIDPAPDIRLLARDIVAARGLTSLDHLQLSVGGHDLLATVNQSASSGWIVAGVVPVETLLAGANTLRGFILGVAILCILAGALCATLVVGRLTRPLRQLRHAMRRVEARDLDTRISVDSEDEVGQLAHGFNTMLDELRRLVDDVLKAQIHEREAELQALQNQINPHFLYNTLESINMLALAHGDRDISRMVTALGRLLRRTISSGDALITLGDELDYVDDYLVVQRMRYGDRIAMTVHVAPALLDYRLPKLTLQPLVENALYHGLEPQRGAGRVALTGLQDGDDLLLTVTDDGVGMDAMTLDAVRAQLQQEPARERRSLGLANVQQRLAIYCGPGYGLTVESTRGAGTRVSVRLPKIPRALREQARTPDRFDQEELHDVSLAHRR